ncbi:MAG TPA: lysoplasmalogenase [Panacibacter sp.]|nr:lysoplasmalogenase [Panacibacter sp.]
MKKTRLLLFSLFWIALVADCFLIISHHDEYRLYTKTLLVPILLISIYSEALTTKHKRSYVLINLAFFFCFTGDFLLLNDADPSNFIFGLTSFLIAHIFFIIFFYRLKPFTAKYRIFLFMAGVSILVYVLCLLFLIWVNVSRQSLEIPVAVYTIALGFMMLTAIGTIKNKSLKRLSANYFIPGAAFFILSDSILAYIKFSSAFSYGGVVVMITYATAIFLIAKGAIIFLRK